MRQWFGKVYMSPCIFPTLPSTMGTSIIRPFTIYQYIFPSLVHNGSLNKRFELQSRLTQHIVWAMTVIFVKKIKMGFWGKSRDWTKVIVKKQLRRSCELRTFLIQMKWKVEPWKLFISFKNNNKNYNKLNRTEKVKRKKPKVEREKKIVNKKKNKI